jgi:hypothetical protein
MTSHIHTYTHTHPVHCTPQAGRVRYLQRVVTLVDGRGPRGDEFEEGPPPARHLHSVGVRVELFRGCLDIYMCVLFFVCVCFFVCVL